MSKEVLGSGREDGGDEEVWGDWGWSNKGLLKDGTVLYFLNLGGAYTGASIQFTSVTQSCLTVTPWTAAHQGSLSITSSRSWLKLMSIESVMPSNHLIRYRPLLLLPSIFPSIRVFSNESVLCIRWPKYWTFSFNISPSNEYSGLISFRMDWMDTGAYFVIIFKNLHMFSPCDHAMVNFTIIKM